MLSLNRRLAAPAHAARVTAGAMIALAIVLASAASQATTVTLDLSSLQTGTFTSPLAVDGFTLTPQLGASSMPQIVDVNGVYTLQSSSNVDAGGADTYLTMTNGGSFSIDSVQIAAVGGDTGTWGIGISNPAGGSESGVTYGSHYGSPVSTSFTIEDLTGYTGLANVTTIDLDPVSDNGDDFAIANITVSYSDVPEPATIELFLVGLAGLAVRRRSNQGL